MSADYIRIAAEVEPWTHQVDEKVVELTGHGLRELHAPLLEAPPLFLNACHFLESCEKYKYFQSLHDLKKMEINFHRNSSGKRIKSVPGRVSAPIARCRTLAAAMALWRPVGVVRSASTSTNWWLCGTSKRSFQMQYTSLRQK